MPRVAGLVAGGLDMLEKYYGGWHGRHVRLSDRGPDDINRRISLLVLNKQAEQAILHETLKARMSR